MATWLSPEWFDEAGKLWSDAPGLDGIAGRVQCEIGGGPHGDVSCHWVFDAVGLEASGVGRVADPDVTLTLGWEDAVAVQRGDLDPNVAFMQGRLKVSGSMELMIALLARAQTTECRDLQQRVARISGF